MFKITVFKWKEINPTHKKGMKKFYITSGILTNPKVAALKPMDFMLYIHCLCVACESSSDEIQINSKSLPKQLRMGDESLTNALRRIESLQLLSWEKTSLIKLNEIKLNKLNETKFPADEPTPVKKPVKPKPEEDPLLHAKRAVWSAYCSGYERRWGVTPKRNAVVNKQIETFVKRLGAEDAPSVIDFYCQHKDSFYVKKAHAFGLALKDAESLYTQWKKGLQLTQAKMKDYERRAEQNEMQDLFQQQYEAELEQEKGGSA